MLNNFMSIFNFIGLYWAIFGVGVNSENFVGVYSYRIKDIHFLSVVINLEQF